MNCFECAKANDDVAAVGICQHCDVGLCLDHLVEARGHRVGGTLYGCNHAMPRAKPLPATPTASPVVGDRARVA